MPNILNSTEALIGEIVKVYPKGFDLTLDRIGRLLAKLDNPQHKLPPIIHVAGTNGKGSTSAFCRTIFEQAGYRVHTHTSPHLVRWNERFRIAGKEGSSFVADDELNATINHILMVNNGEPITLFEILTAAAFLLFSEHPADIAIIEVGLGGRFDATNIIAKSAVSVITPISMDHEAYLGNTIEEIAFEKAGIIKANCPVIIGYQQSEDASKILKMQAAKHHAPVSSFGEEYFASAQHGRMVYQDQHRLLDLPLPKLAGDHQITNAAAAIAAAGTLSYHVSEDAIARALGQTNWPARLQHITRGNLVDISPSGADIWLDGGHNPAGSQVLACHMRKLAARDPRPLLIVAGMINSKDSTGFFKNFVGLAHEIFTVPIATSDASVSAQHLAAVVATLGIRVKAKEELTDALNSIAQRDGAPRILICGSLYLAGEALALNGTIPQ